MKKRTLAVFIAAGLLLCGCSGKNNNDNNTNKDIDNNVDNNINYVVGDYDFSYNEKTDSSVGYEWGYMSESHDGYYVSLQNNLKFLDSKLENCVPLCSNPDCTHNTEECVSYIDRNGISLSSSVYYNDGYVYETGVEKVENTGCDINLYRLKDDGTSFEKYMTLYRLEVNDDETPGYPEICIHRGYVYYVIPFQSTMKLQRMKLGSKEAETVYEMTGDRQNLYRIKAYGNHIFFQAGNFLADNIDINASIFSYDIDTGKVEKVVENAVSYYGIGINRLYYSLDGGVQVYDFEKKTSEEFIGKIYEEQSMLVSDKYVTVYDKSNMQVYDFTGKKVYERNLDKDDISAIYGIDGDTVFVYINRKGKPEIKGIQGLGYFKISSDDALVQVDIYEIEN